MPTKIILDTDIGDDIDDACALALILGSPEFDLLGVTTVFGNVDARVRQAQTVLKMAGCEGVPVAAGVGAPISPRLSMESAPADHGVAGHPVLAPTRQYLDGIRPCQDGSALPADQLPAPDPRGAVTFLIDTIRANPGLTVCTVGAQTNLAVALAVEPRLVNDIGRVVAMAGHFNEPRPEWNIVCDPVAAALVANSGVETFYVGIDVTRKCVMTPEQLDRLFTADTPIAQNLSNATRMWQARCAEQGHPNRRPMLHDPLAVATILKPDLVETRTGTVRVELAGEHTYGLTLFREVAHGQTGRHTVCTDVNADAFLTFWLDSILTL